MSTTEIQIQIADFLFTLDYYPGCAPVTSGPADNWDPGDPPELEVKTIEREESCSRYVPATWADALYALDTSEEDLTQELDEKAMEEFIERETERHYGYDDTYGW